MEGVEDQVLEAFVEACRNAARRGLMRCSSGNISRRLDATRLIATGSGSWLERLSTSQVSVCRISDGALLDGPKQTVEIGFHAAILRMRTDMNVVMHFQTPFATTLACRRTEDVDFFVIPEIPVYIGPVGWVPYVRPGSQELAEAVARVMQSHDMALLRNHGVVMVAKDYAQAIQNAEFFELACEIIVRAGDALKPLPLEEVESLLALRAHLPTQ